MAALQAISSAGHDSFVCVGAGPATARWGPEAGGTLDAFGVRSSYGGAAWVLPPALTIAAYLLDEAGVVDVDVFQAIAADATAKACSDLGEELAQCSERVAMLVMGDGSAKLTLSSPGYQDPRAGPFDADVVRALSKPDPEALLRIDPVLAADLWVAGRASWQVLAGALAQAAGRVTGSVAYYGAPLGVGYFVVQLTTD
jgi:aromatic ring-opening dioxygenase LigB subunit